MSSSAVRIFHIYPGHITLKVEFLEIELWYDRIWISSTLLGNAKLFSQIVISVYIPIRNIRDPVISHSHQCLLLSSQS
jgi:hypothetical protein